MWGYRIVFINLLPFGIPLTLYNNMYYYSFKIFLRFWLVKAAHIINHNQLLLMKYWTNDIKSAARRKLLNRWHQNDVKSAAHRRLLNRSPRKPGERVVLFWWAEKQRAKWRNSFKNGEIFWMNNKAIIEFGFRRIRRILQISEDVIHLGLRPLWITPSLICRILHILRKPNSIIAKYTAYWCRNEIHSKS